MEFLENRLEEIDKPAHSGVVWVGDHKVAVISGGLKIAEIGVGEGDNIDAIHLDPDEVYELMEFVDSHSKEIDKLVFGDSWEPTNIKWFIIDGQRFDLT